MKSQSSRLTYVKEASPMVKQDRKEMKFTIIRNIKINY